MLHRRWLAAFLILGLGVSGVVFGQDTKKEADKKPEEKPAETKVEEKKTEEKKDDQAANLQWKFEKGKTFYQEISTETKQNMKVGQNEIAQNQKQTFFYSWTPQEQDKDKNWVVKQKIEGVKIDIDIGNNKVSFDSTKEGPANPLSDFFKALVGSEFTLTLSPDYKVVKIEGRDEFLKKLTTANQQIKPMLDQILSEDALKQLADPAFAFVPNKPIKKGDTWSKQSKLSMGPIGTYEVTYNYDYQGKDDKKLDKIGVRTDMKYSRPTEMGALPFTIEKGDLKVTESAGTILFDNEKGRLASSEMKMKLDGTLTIKVGGTSTEVQVTQTQTTNTKTSDDNPLKAKPTP